MLVVPSAETTKKNSIYVDDIPFFAETMLSVFETEDRGYCECIQP
jgi:hypothetical protein